MIVRHGWDPFSMGRWMRQADRKAPQQAPWLSYLVTMRSLLWSMAVLLPLLTAAQGTVIARVVDADTRMPLPYATVLLKGTSQGTITNKEGWFSLPLQGPKDSLRFSFVGYRTLVLPLAPSMDGQDIRMERAVHELGEAVIRPGEDLYARLVAASNWLRRAPAVKTKLFFGLETHSEEQPVEVLNAYFNATFKSAVMRGVSFKQGSIGIAPKDGRHFINYNTAGAFALMDIHAPGERFPLSPFPFADKRGLREYYLVELVSSGKGREGVDHLRATPRPNAPGAFVLDLWLVAGKSDVRAFELECSACPRHPFIPLFDHGRIDTVDMRYRQTWTTDDRPFPEVTELEYHVVYSGPGFTDRFTTHAIMHAFDRGRHFLPTLFPWKQGLEEYPMIAWMPLDSAFWKRMTPPIPTERQARDRAFVMAHDVARNTWFDSLRLAYDHLRPYYLAWNADRPIDMHHLRGAPVIRPNDVRRPPPVRLRTHLYLDLDTTGGALHHRSIAVFDAGSSWYLHAPLYPEDQALVNLVFDICEMERRAMEERLTQPGMTLEKARRIHAEHTQRMRDTQEKYWNAINQQFYTILSWNMKVRHALGVDRLHQLVYVRPGPQDHAIPPYIIQGRGTY